MVVVKRKYRTREYSDWIEEAAWLLKSLLRNEGVRPPVVVHMTIYGGRGFAVNRDLDNVAKCVGDALVESKVIESDDVRNIRRWVLSFYSAEEHLAILGGNRPSNKATLQARLLVGFETWSPNIPG